MIKERVHEGMGLYGHPLWRIMENGGSFYRYLPFFGSVYQRFKTCCAELTKYVGAHIEKQKEALKFREIEEPENLVEAFLKEQRIREKDGIRDQVFR